MEQDSRVLALSAAPPFASSARVTTLPAEGMGRLFGTEAMTSIGEGDARRLLAFTEHGPDGRSPVFLIDPASGAREALSVRLRDGYAPTGATRLAGGDIILLERRYSPSAGMRMRIRRIAAADIRPGAVVEGALLLEEGAGTLTDNMEGISAFTMPDGEERLAIVSDDNRWPLQRTLYLEFAFASRE